MQHMKAHKSRCGFEVILKSNTIETTENNYEETCLIIKLTWKHLCEGINWLSPSLECGAFGTAICLLLTLCRNCNCHNIWCREKVSEGRVSFREKQQQNR